ncbi:hypothetical protein [Nocardia crassostreae]|uniref:hypothetical protein n=1 Tax=Nocardia crassostreae TaxID=53428 RepID=UPI000B0E8A08|nr:hypothetical protein [Nocardia crassostreae]
MIEHMTEWQLQVPLAELRRSLEWLMDYVEAATAGDTVHLDQDYFWSVPPDELYDVDRAPVNLTIGQLSWSWQHVRDLLADPDRAVGHHLIWLSEVLRAVGHKLP